MSLVLRPYQTEAVQKGLEALHNYKDNSLIIAATGAGKSLIISGIANEVNKEILILQPSLEILKFSE